MKGKRMKKVSNVKVARIKRGYTQRELITMVNISPNSLVKIERGDYSALKYDTMIKLSKILGETVDNLFFYEQGDKNE